MVQLTQTEHFSRWLSRLKDIRAKARILTRLEDVRLGHFGDYKSLKGGLFELRTHVGKGYRVYFTRKRKLVILLLFAGTKSSQSRDIQHARSLLSELRL
ncbi:MAG: type II toxin-antitoxin system RelE/ParE family toxin [Gammaproteobacteria bacterium]|jgi:putative addiction module killer protein|nr:hypothetical protein [Gammaproteobacteria bacterium]MDP6097094.1 type II toxin-antitoxin system RelE/ParE family toxin [Gammaproteobacteria bacterium]HJO11222.1 type II toxin-antitoxin system RelE/ParE family toxin [Gammaproteobacteria bacterium]